MTLATYLLVVCFTINVQGQPHRYCHVEAQFRTMAQCHAAQKRIASISSKCLVHEIGRSPK